MSWRERRATCGGSVGSTMREQTTITKAKRASTRKVCNQAAFITAWNFARARLIAQSRPTSHEFACKRCLCSTKAHEIA